MDPLLVGHQYNISMIKPRADLLKTFQLQMLPVRGMTRDESHTLQGDKSQILRVHDFIIIIYYSALLLLQSKLTSIL